MPRRIKSRYFVDKENLLVIKRGRKILITDGRFSVDRNNRLSYWLNEPVGWRRQYGLPNRISLKGNWRLNPNYDLELNLAETKEQYKGDRLVLKGEIITIDKDILAFEIISYDKQGLTHIQLLKLTGFWQADEFNRIGFMVKKASPDILLFKGSWQMGRNQQIIYTYEKTDLKTKTKTSHTLTFEGYWQISSADRFTYIFSHSSKSRFDFRVQIESPNLYPQEGVIKYRVGVGLRETKPLKNKIISLYGIWKFSRKLGLLFQVDYGEDKLPDIEFGANVHLNKKNEFVFSLINKRKEPLGLNLIFTHKFLKQSSAETFLRLKDILGKKERILEAGVRIPF